MKLKNLLKIFISKKHFFFRVDMVNSDLKQVRLSDGEKTFLTGYGDSRVIINRDNLNSINDMLKTMTVKSFSEIGLDGLSESDFVVTQLSRLD